MAYQMKSLFVVNLSKASFVEMFYFPAPSSTVKHSLNDTSINNFEGAIPALGIFIL
jgi:hypothetical protein